MLATIFMALNAFIVLFVAGTMMFSNFKPDIFKKLLYLSLGLIILPIAGIAIMNLLGKHIYWVTDLIFMRGGSIGIPVTFGYGIALGLLLNRVRTTLFPRKEGLNEENKDESGA